MLQRKTFLTLAAGLALGASLPAWAQGSAATPAFPTKPVRIVVASSAGSGPDAAMRAVGEKLSQKWGQPVIIDNRPGGNGFIAVSAFKNAQPDGHELINLDSSHMTTHPHTFSRLPYDPQKDFEPVRPLLLTDFFVVVAKDSPFKTLDDIVAAAKAQPGRVTYGSWFNGSPGPGLRDHPAGPHRRARGSGRRHPVPGQSRRRHGHRPDPGGGWGVCGAVSAAGNAFKALSPAYGGCAACAPPSPQTPAWSRPGRRRW